MPLSQNITLSDLTKRSTNFFLYADIWIEHVIMFLLFPPQNTYMNADTRDECSELLDKIDQALHFHMTKMQITLSKFGVNLNLSCMFRILDFHLWYCIALWIPLMRWLLNASSAQNDIVFIFNTMSFSFWALFEPQQHTFLLIHIILFFPLFSFTVTSLSLHGQFFFLLHYLATPYASLPLTELELVLRRSVSSSQSNPVTPTLFSIPRDLLFKPSIILDFELLGPRTLLLPPRT